MATVGVPPLRRNLSTEASTSERASTVVDSSALCCLCCCPLPHIIPERPPPEPRALCGAFGVWRRHWLPPTIDCPGQQSCSVLRNVLYHKRHLHRDRRHHRLVYVVHCGRIAARSPICATVAHNLGSETKKATGIPLYMAIGQCGSVLGSHIFPATEGPRYMYVILLVASSVRPDPLRLS